MRTMWLGLAVVAVLGAVGGVAAWGQGPQSTGMVPVAAPTTMPATGPAVMAPFDVGDALLRTAAGERGINKPTNDALALKMDAFRFEKEPLQRVLDAFAREAKVLVWVNWSALQSESITPETPVTVNLAGVPAGRVLRDILMEVSPETRLGFVVDDNRVVVSTNEDVHSSKYQVVRVYNLTPLLADLELNGSEAVEVAQLVTDTLKSVVRPDTWRDNGGSIGSARVINGQMIINQSLDYQEEVARFVDAISQGPGVPTRMYDVRDLVPEANGNEHGGKLAELVQAIKTTCGRDTWRDQGGRTSSLAAFDGRLYITTNPAVHEQIAYLLKLMRSPEGTVPAGPRAGVAPPIVTPGIKDVAVPK